MLHLLRRRKTRLGEPKAPPEPVEPETQPIDINALPDELLCAIFASVLSDVRASAEKSAFDGERLYATIPFQVVASRVCKRWNQLINSTPTLWSSATIQVYGALARRVGVSGPKRIQYFLQKSKTAPLDVLFDSRTSCAEMSLQHDSSYLLSLHANRIESLKLWVFALSCLEQVLRDLHGTHTQNLRSLDIQIASVPSTTTCSRCTPVVPSTDGKVWRQAIDNLPRLSKLKTTGLCVLDLPIPSTLTYLDINHIHTHPIWISQVLRQTPNLHALVLRDLRPPRGYDHDHHAPVGTLTVALPFLHSLALEFTVCINQTGPLLPQFDVPSLTRFEICLLPTTGKEKAMLNPKTATHLLPLVEQTSVFRILTDRMCYFCPLLTSSSIVPGRTKLEFVGVSSDVVDALPTLIADSNFTTIIFDMNEVAISNLRALMKNDGVPVGATVGSTSSGRPFPTSSQRLEAENDEEGAFMRCFDTPDQFKDSDIILNDLHCWITVCSTTLRGCKEGHTKLGHCGDGSCPPPLPPIRILRPNEHSRGLLDATRFLSDTDRALRDPICGLTMDLDSVIGDVFNNL